MSRPMTVSESVVIGVAPSVVYAGVSDPTQTGRWSPENLGARVEGRPAGTRGGLAVDDTFVGSNRRGRYRWATRCRVIAADVDERFAFRVEAIGLRTPRLKAPIATWEYDLQAVPEGTRVTETWTDGRAHWSDRAARVFDKIATGSTFAEFNRRNIRSTLDKLKAELEAAPA